MKVKTKFSNKKRKPLEAEEKAKIINKLISGNLEQQMIYYIGNLFFTKNYTIICVNEKEQKPLLDKINKLINNKRYTLYTPFYDDRIYTLNYNEGLRGLMIISGIDEKLTYRVKHDIPVTLDANITSYIRNFYEFGVNTENIEDFIKNIKYTSISCGPYIVENLIKPYLYYDNHSMLKEINKEINKHEIRNNDIYKTLFAFEKIFPKKSKILSKSNQYCHRNVVKIFDFYKKRNVIIELANLYKFEYICLLKMIIIQLKYKKKSVDYKMRNFIEFMHSELYSIIIPEINLAYEYFKKGNNISFFRKIQKNRKGVLEDIKNMAWDIYHLRSNIIEFKTFDRKKTDTVIPVFVTYDNDLNDIRKLFQLKSIIIHNKSNWNRPTYYINRVNSKFMKKYGSIEAQMTRTMNGRKKSSDIYIGLIMNLEKELSYYLYESE